MAANFNPYNDWLEISGDGPRTHYELLGLPAFETDEAQIHSAYQKRYARVRVYEVGQHSEAASKLLHELSEAYACLTHADQKHQYDRDLRARATVSDDAAESATAVDLSAGLPTDVRVDTPADRAGSVPGRLGTSGADLTDRSATRKPPRSRKKPPIKRGRPRTSPSQSERSQQEPSSPLTTPDGRLPGFLARRLSQSALPFVRLRCWIMDTDQWIGELLGQPNSRLHNLLRTLALVAVLAMGVGIYQISTVPEAPSPHPDIATAPPPTPPSQPEAIDPPPEPSPDQVEKPVGPVEKPTEPEVAEDPQEAKTDKPKSQEPEYEPPKNEKPKQQTPSKPPAPRNPFPDFAAAVDLPPITSVNEETTDSFVLGTIDIAGEAFCYVDLIGGENACQDEQTFRMRRGNNGLAERDWEILRHDSKTAGDAGERIADLSLREKELVFQWTAAAKSSPVTNHLRNCMLYLRNGSAAHAVALRQPLEVAPFVVQLDKGKSRGRFYIPWLPAPESIQVEITTLDGQFPNATFEPQQAFAAAKGSVTIKVGEAGNQPLLFRVDSFLTAKLQLVMTPYFLAARDALPQELNKRNAQKMSQMAAVAQLRLQDTIKNRTYSSRQYAQELYRINAFMEQMNALQGYCEDVDNGRIHFRVFYAVGSHCVDLLRSSDAAVPAEPAA